MRKYLLFLLLVLCSFDAHAIYRYRLYLKDKEGSVRYPLSDRALERRNRQGIDLNTSDLEVSPAYLTALKEAGYHIVCQSRWLNTVVVANNSGTPIPEAEFNALDFVDHFQLITTNENVQAPRRNLTRGGDEPIAATENYRTPILECRGDALLSFGHCGAGMLVAVLDAGFVRANVLDATKDKIVGCHDILRPGDDSCLYTEDENHGVMCLSIMCTSSEYGVWGSAPDADYFLIRTECAPSETAFEEDTWVAGAEMADSIGADVISSSLGYYEFDNSTNNHTHAQLKTLDVFVAQGADIATTKGMLVVVAAGNERGSSWNAIDFPSNVPNVLAVGATDPDGVLAYFSSPGFTVPYIKPDVVCRGQNAYMIEPYTGKVRQGNGTSFATPLMAGLCTSLWSAVPELTSLELLQIVRESSTRHAAPDSLYGYGFPKFDVALNLALQHTGVEPVFEQASPLETMYFDLQGRPLTNPRKNSLYIRQNGGNFVIIRE